MYVENIRLSSFWISVWNFYEYRTTVAVKITFFYNFFFFEVQFVQNTIIDSIVDSNNFAIIHREQLGTETCKIKMNDKGTQTDGYCALKNGIY